MVCKNIQVTAKLQTRDFNILCAFYLHVNVLICELPVDGGLIVLVGLFGIVPIRGIRENRLDIGRQGICVLILHCTIFVAGRESVNVILDRFFQRILGFVSRHREGLDLIMAPIRPVRPLASIFSLDPMPGSPVNIGIDIRVGTGDILDFLMGLILKNRAKTIVPQTRFCTARAARTVDNIPFCQRIIRSSAVAGIMLGGSL